MDSITHAFLGAATAQLGLRQRIGRDAVWVAAIAAMAPDLDLLVAPALNLVGMGDAMGSMRYHRGITHSIVAIPVYAAALAGIWWLARRKVRERFNGTNGPSAGAAAPQDARPKTPTPYWLLYVCILAPLLTHAFLDLCLSYGTQLFAPLTDRRYAIDTIAIVDLIYTPILMLTVLACYVVRKVKHSVAARSTFAIGLGGMLLSTGYLCLGRCLHDAAIERARTVCAQRHLLEPDKIVRADAFPAAGSVLLWRVVFETDSAWVAARIHFCAADNASVRTSTAPRVDNQWVRRARKLPEVQTLDWFTMGHMRAEYHETAGMNVVEFHDTRYAPATDSLDSMWGCRVVFNRQTGQVTESSFTHGRRARQGMVSSAWSDLWNP